MFMTQRCGDTLLFRTPPVIAAQAAVGGKKEGEGPLHSEFDAVIEDDLFGEETWEKAESRFHYTAAVEAAIIWLSRSPPSGTSTLSGVARAFFRQVSAAV